jgi:hypothetical protein
MRAVVFALAVVASLAASAHAQPAPAPPPYSLGWQLRPAGVATAVRADTAIATYGDATGDGATVVSTWLASYRATPTLAPLVRVAVSRDVPPAGDGDGATGLSNLLLGVAYAPRGLPAPWRAALYGLVTLPVGTGGGNAPDATMAAVNRAAVLARSGMDNALFAVNDATAIVGGDVAWVRGGLTVQGEVTMFELVRVRGADVQPDAARTNLTSALHVGWFPARAVSVGAELRYQRFLSTPAAVAAMPALRDTLSAAVGVRAHVRLGPTRWLRPGLAYARGLDDPMTGRGYDVVLVDVPLSF